MKIESLGQEVALIIAAPTPPWRHYVLAYPIKETCEIPKIWDAGPLNNQFYDHNTQFYVPN